MHARVVEVLRAGTGRGSGFAVAADMVLTAAHVVSNEAAVRVIVGGQDMPGVVVWRDPGLDAALVQVPVRPWDGIDTRWAAVSGMYAVSCTAIGYPRVQKTDDGTRAEEQIAGFIMPVTGRRIGRYAVNVTTTQPYDLPLGLSPWSGLSGAAVLTADGRCVLGVLIEDPTGFEASRLEAVPVAALLDDAGFAGLVGADRSGMVVVTGGPGGDWPRAQQEGLRSLTPAGVPERTAVNESLLRVDQWDPHRLGVQPSIKVLEADRHRTDHGRELGPLPLYLRRQIDSELRDAVRTAARYGGLIVLVGDSSVGKTRSAMEAIRTEVRDWRLLRPFSPTEVTALVEEGRLPERRTVLWLDELELFIDGPEALSLNEMHRLVNPREPTIIIGTLWPEVYEQIMNRKPPPLPMHNENGPTGSGSRPSHGAGHRTTFGPNPMRDPHRSARQILGTLARCIFVKTFGDEERAWARTYGGYDPRIRVALGDPNFGVTEILAGAPELVRRWLYGSDLYGAAVITAAIDARRIGIRAPLPRGFFETAALSLVSEPDKARAGAEWLDKAIGYATQAAGATSALLPVTGQGSDGPAAYIVADYLAQYGSRLRDAQPIARGLWTAVADHIAWGRDLHRAAVAARLRLHYPIAERLFHKAAECGSVSAYSALGRLYLEMGRPNEAVDVFAIGFSQGDVAAGRILGRDAAAVKSLLTQSEPTDDADRLRIAKLLRAAGVFNQALDLLATVSEPRYEFWALRATLLQDAGKQQEALDCLREAITEGHEALWRRLVDLLRVTGREDEAVTVLRSIIESGDLSARRDLAALYLDRGREEAALDLYRQAADDGDHRARIAIVRAHMRRGRIDDAINELRDGIANRQIPLHEIGMFANFFDAMEAAIGMCRAAVEMGIPGARRRLARALERDGRIHEALDVRRAAAAANDPYALRELGEALLRWRENEEAETVLRQAIEVGDNQAYAPLANRYAGTRRYSEAIAVWTEAIAAGQRQGHRRIGELHEQAMRLRDARQSYETAALVGDAQGALKLVALLRRRDPAAAEHLFRKGLEPPAHLT